MPKFDGCTFIIHSQRIKWFNKNNCPNKFPSINGDKDDNDNIEDNNQNNGNNQDNNQNNGNNQDNNNEECRICSTSVE